MRTEREPVLHFSKPALEDSLRRLAGPRRVAFAASAAERLRLAYVEPTEQRGTRQAEVFSALLDLAWLSVTGNASEQELSASLRQIEELTESGADELEPEGDVDELPDEPMFALASALQTGISHNVTSAATAAEWVYNFLDGRVAERPGMPKIITGRDVPEYNQRIEADPIIQAELRRQHADIDALAKGDRDIRRLAESLRERARQSASEILRAK